MQEQDWRRHELRLLGQLGAVTVLVGLFVFFAGDRIARHYINSLPAPDQPTIYSGR